MYPIQCYAGFPVPMKAGKFEIVGYSVAPSAIGTQMDIGLVDDDRIKATDLFGKTFATETECIESNNVIHFAKVPANGGSFDFIFPEPIKTIFGVSTYATNVRVGTFTIYIK